MLAHRVDGSGPALVLLNGGLMSIGAWQPYAQVLAEEFTVIRCDFRGQLLTPGPAPLTFEEHAADVVDVLDHLGVQRAHFVGTSYGGEVAAVAAALFPRRVESLAIITATDRVTPEMKEEGRELREAAEAAAAGGDGARVFRLIAKNSFSGGYLAKQPADFLDARAGAVSKLPPAFFEGLAGLMRPLEELDLSHYLAKITSPTIVMAAADDRVFPLEHSRALAAGIDGATLVVIDDSGHAAVVEQTEQVLSALREFLRQHSFESSCVR